MSAGKNRLFSDLADICHDFYRRYFPHEKIADDLDKILRRHRCKKIVFIGGLLDVARLLEKRGYEITFVDYTPQMLARAKTVLRKARFVLSDMRALSLPAKADAVIAIGRSFTYMYSDADALKTLRAFGRALGSGGILVIDNYETGKIDEGAYFNGTVRRGGIARRSRMKKMKAHPALYRWDAVYCKRTARYPDSGHILRAFSKPEIERLIGKAGLEFLAHRANFERRSFITVVRKSGS